MSDRRDFGDFYPGGGTATVSPPAENVGARVAVIEGKVAAVAAAAAELPEMDPDGGEALADVKEGLTAVKGVLEGLA